MRVRKIVWHTLALSRSHKIMIFRDNRFWGLHVSPTSISLRGIDDLSSDVRRVSEKKIRCEGLPLWWRSEVSRELRFAHRSFYLYFRLNRCRRDSLPSSLHQIHRIQYFPGVSILPSVFGGCISALSPILSRRQLQTRRPITVSDEGAAGTREPPFFGIACKYLDLILFARKLCLPAKLLCL